MQQTHKPQKNHKSGPCVGRGCPICKQQRLARNKTARQRGGGSAAPASFSAGLVLTRGGFMVASPAFYEARAREREEQDALAQAQADANMDVQLAQYEYQVV